MRILGRRHPNRAEKGGLAATRAGMLALLAAFAAGEARAAPAPARGSAARDEATAASRDPSAPDLATRLTRIRSRVMVLQQELLDSLHGGAQAKANVKKIQSLLKLQREERALGKERLGELEHTVQGLEERRQGLSGRVRTEQSSVRRSLMALERSASVEGSTGGAGEGEDLEAPRRKSLANLVDRSLKEVEALRVDLSDADQLETRIQEEKQQLAYLFQDLNEQESVLELNQQLQSDLLRKNHNERLAQLEGYRKLKSAESQVEHLIGEFNARIELERVNESEHVAAKAESTRRQALAQAPLATTAVPPLVPATAGPAISAGAGQVLVSSLTPANGAVPETRFSLLKGRLGLPVDDGKIVSSFGQVFDAKTRLHIFKKGIDISTGKKQPVHAVSGGKVAFSGELPDYGRVAIIDHGDHFYTLCAHLGELTLHPGASVRAGDEIGSTDDSGTPVYFEIRARNVAVNPLQWLAN